MDGQRARALLGVAPDASAHDIKKQYRRLAKACHPDASGSAAVFDLLTRCYRAATADTARRPSSPFLTEIELGPPVPAPRLRRPRQRPLSFAEHLDRALVP